MPTIKISYSSKELIPIRYGYRYNKKKEDIEEVMKSIVVGIIFIDLPMIDYGE